MPEPRAQATGLSVVVPTKDEAGNVELLVRRLERMVERLPLVHRPLEIIFVDDSDDDTALVISRISSSLDVRLIHRPPAERDGGLGGAVVAGMRAARAPRMCVMDADLQHPPEVIEEMLGWATETPSDLVVASRFCKGGEASGLSGLRRMLSSICSTIATLLFPKRLGGVSDPLSGFFLVRREALSLEKLRQGGSRSCSRSWCAPLTSRSPRSRFVLASATSARPRPPPKRRCVTCASSGV